MIDELAAAVLDPLGRVTPTGGGGAVLATTGLLALLAVAAALLAPSSRPLVAATGVSLAGVLGLTVVPTGGWARFGITPAARDSIATNLRPLPGDLTAWAHAPDGPPNVALFVPLGLCLALLLRRPLTAVLLAVALSVAVECYQAALTTRVGAFADVVANGLGAFLGAALGGAVLALLRRTRYDVRTGPAQLPPGLRTAPGSTAPPSGWVPRPAGPARRR
jgi:hypothetical protein